MARDTEKLGRYWAKRDFTKTPEPAGVPSGQDQDDGRRRFVVQRHRARRLHYDLRFEIDGVLVSWAVPNGPTLDPAVKRLAVHVEDHPIEYLDFEGVIPSGEYGGGDVIVWDLGTWEPHATDDPAAAVKAGELHVDVTGQKLRGRLILVRSGGRGGRAGRARGAADHAGGESEQWLLLHKDDEAAVRGWNPEDHPRSVLSGRTNDEVRADPDRLWRSDLPPAEASIELRPPTIPGPDQDELDALEALSGNGSWEVFGR
ncbi:MAG TPA: DNA polymerase ligase N-terminal domain-containing protein, partial [Streptosporangiaceae bacterium]